MEALYHQTNKLVEETQHCFVKLEKCLNQDTKELENEIQIKLNEIVRNCEKLELMARKDPITRMQTTKTRVDQLKHENKHLHAAFQMLQQKKRRKEMEMQEREELLQRKFTSLREDETAILIDHSINHQNALQRANRGLDDLLATSKGVLENLQEQRMTLKGAHKKLIDFANTLGLSNTTMRLIENRVKEDKWILLGGMLITMLIIIFVIFYVKR